MASCSSNQNDPTSPDNPDHPELPQSDSAKYIHEIVAYHPAPGQFINQKIGTLEGAKALIGNKDHLLSLGAFGGSVVVGFSPAIQNLDGNDFVIYGNAFTGSSEMGIVAVAEQEDGPWYELKGSEYEAPETNKAYEVTYHKPQNELDDIIWTDNEGKSDTVKYMGQLTQNKQSHWPANESKDFTVSGTRLKSFTTIENGKIVNQKPEGGFGYADMSIGGDAFDIDWAVDENGHAKKLQQIRYIKVYTGLQVNASILGEVSTEIKGIENLHYSAK
ncbi:hypothetical protein [Persicobacter psychrovividus]|uniref:Lipoprotein n=1 Tax=Persicobacter psychrovividus TaxID=387638 RepID=A0ABN6LEY6_9BACT|nr:hypothetical protein PEPS_39220 [Persicobacter psychrovividus]